MSEWINVKDRLPEEWVDVLVFSKAGFQEIAVWIGIPGVWRVSWNHNLMEKHSVTHWMPLPKPPEEGTT